MVSWILGVRKNHGERNSAGASTLQHDFKYYIITTNLFIIVIFCNR